MNLPTIAICIASAKTDLNLIFEAMGRGPNNLSRKLCAIDPLATHETPATHYMFQDMSATDSLVAEWNAMAEDQNLPAIQGIWGEDGVISAQDAQAALATGNLRLFSAAGLADTTERDDWRNGTLAGAGLQFVPDEPI